MPEWPERVAAALGLDAAGVDGPRAVADVSAPRWHEAVRVCRDELGCDFFDWLSAVDDTATEAEPDGAEPDKAEPDGAGAADGARDDTEDDAAPVVGMRIVAHLWSVSDRRGVLLRTVAAPTVPTVTDLYVGAFWHERETAEMFGVGFDGHPDPAPLLLPPEFEGHPLRKDFVLASRVVKPWPGAKEPGGGRPGPRKRAPKRPPGVPEDWMEGPAGA